MKTVNFTTQSARALLAAGQHLQRKDAGDPIDMIARKFGEHTDEVHRQLKATAQKVDGLDAMLREVEQKASRTGPVEQRAESWGEQFTQQAELKFFAENHSRPGRFRMDVKAITNGTTSGGALGTNYRDQNVLLARRRMTIRDLLPVVQISSNLAEYVRQTARPTAAATVAEGAVKPESQMTLAMVTTPTQVIAHWIAASRQVLEDVPQLRDLIDGELRYGLAEREEMQILAGDGTGTNLLGLIPQATAFVDPLLLAGPNRIDTLGAAILQNALADFPADGIVLHPSDWMRMRMLKDTDGKYLLGAPGAAVEPVLFGLPVVETKAMTAGTFMVGNFQSAATIYDRWQPRVEISTEHADFFTSNKVAILAEERLALAVKNAKALTYGTFA